ncbi:MAG: 50S ribosomal protein L18 [Thermoplasmata archaeon]|nr:50S ribosomal protein L18 [Thermoplasmata archaeon]
MAHGPRYHVPYKRRAQGRTDYNRRLALLTSRKPRAVVRHTGRHMIVQFIEYRPDGDHVIVGVTSNVLKGYGWDAGLSNTPAAYMTGYIGARKALVKGVDEAVLDIGLYTPTPGSRVFAALRGMIDAGLLVPHSEDPLPSVERIEGDEMREMFKSAMDRITEDLGGPEEANDDD